MTKGSTRRRSPPKFDVHVETVWRVLRAAGRELDNLQLRQGRHGKGTVMKCADCGSHNIISTPITAPTRGH